MTGSLQRGSGLLGKLTKDEGPQCLDPPVEARGPRLSLGPRGHHAQRVRHSQGPAPGGSTGAGLGHTRGLVTYGEVLVWPKSGAQHKEEGKLAAKQRNRATRTSLKGTPGTSQPMREEWYHSERLQD